MSTLAQLIAQQKELEAQIAAARKAELSGAISQAKALIAEFGLTADDLFGGARAARKSSSSVVAPKYKDPMTGATWTGRGKAPKWIDGKDRSQFAI